MLEGLRKHCPELIVCFSTSGRDFPEFEKRSEVIELKPDMCSLTLSSLNFLKQASINAPDMIQRLALKMKENGVKPEMECFDMGMINYGKYLINKKIIEGPFYWNILFGNIAGLQPTFSEFAAAVQAVPEGHYISFGGLGNFQLPTTSAAIAMNVGVRVGLEDNIWFDNQKSTLCTNLDLVKRTHELIALNQKEYISAKEFGELGYYNKQAREKITPSRVI